MISPADRNILRELARRYAEVAADPVQSERRNLWRRHNSLKDTQIPIYVRAFAWNEMPQSACRCENPFFRFVENELRRLLFWSDLNDDSIFEPWITVDAVYACGGWGLAGKRHYGDEPGGSFKIDYPIKESSDLDKLVVPRHEINESETAARVRIVTDAIGDLLTVNLNRGPAYQSFSGDLATDLGYLRGIENFMLDMLDAPEWLHRLVAFLSAGVLKTHDEAEAAGDWGLANHQNQAMAYAEELADPAPNTRNVARKELWSFMAAQEFTAVSPAMHEEFLLQYQRPVLERFGLVAYGCCEDLSRKIDMLRSIPNLRRIAVSPFADVARCAEQIGRDYVVSYRPSPSDMVGYGLDEDRVRSILGRDLAACRHCHTDITLKDVQTVEKDPDRVRRWVALTRRIIGT